MSTKSKSGTGLGTEDLANLIRYHNEKYFNGEPVITDAEYDGLIAEMKDRDPENPVLSEVGSDPSYGKKVEHENIMGSLEKFTYDDEEEDDITSLMNWAHDKVDGGGKLVVMPKVDGLALRLVYKNGILVQAATRGNGDVGQDVTDNIKQIKSIPNVISEQDEIEIRGEAYMKKENFTNFHDTEIAAGRKAPANARNSTSGLVNNKDPKETGKVPLHFWSYDVRTTDVWAETEKELQDAVHTRLSEFAYVPVEVVDVNTEAVLDVIHKWEKIREELPYGIDGLVFAVNDIPTQEHWGYKGKCPVAKIAFKFRPEQAETTLIDIVWQLGRTGKLTPVAQLEPVKLCGTTVDSPTLHNYAQIRYKNICIGDKLLIEKAGEIIPQVVRVTEENVKGGDRKDRSVINYPEICPSCFKPTELDDREISVWCRNPTCPGQAESRIVHFLKTIEVDGVGPGIVSTLINGGLVETIPDLFCLDFAEVSKLEGLGRSSARNIMSAISAKKEIPLAVFLDSLGIHGLGTTTSKLIANEFTTLGNVLRVHPSKFEALEGIGEKTACSINNGLVLLGGMIDKLLELGVNVMSVKKVVGGLTGKSFCITGTLSVGRKEMSALIESHGGTIKSSVSKGLDYLVAGDDVGKSKTDKARKYGTEVIDEDTVREMMGE